MFVFNLFKITISTNYFDKFIAFTQINNTTTDQITKQRYLLIKNNRFIELFISA